MIEAVCGGTRPSKWDGMKCSDLAPILSKGIATLKSNPEKYRMYEPENKWGTVESTIKFLEDIHRNCIEYPTAVVEVCW